MGAERLLNGKFGLFNHFFHIQLLQIHVTRPFSVLFPSKAEG